MTEQVGGLVSSEIWQQFGQLLWRTFGVGGYQSLRRWPAVRGVRPVSVSVVREMILVLLR